MTRLPFPLALALLALAAAPTGGCRSDTTGSVEPDDGGFLGQGGMTDEDAGTDTSACVTLSACCDAIDDPATNLACAADEKVDLAQTNSNFYCANSLATYMPSCVTPIVGTAGTCVKGTCCVVLGDCCSAIMDSALQQSCQTSVDSAGTGPDSDATCAKELTSYADNCASQSPDYCSILLTCCDQNNDANCQSAEQSLEMMPDSEGLCYQSLMSYEMMGMCSP